MPECVGVAEKGRRNHGAPVSNRSSPGAWLGWGSWGKRRGGRGAFIAARMEGDRGHYGRNQEGNRGGLLRVGCAEYQGRRRKKVTWAGVVSVLTSGSYVSEREGKKERREAGCARSVSRAGCWAGIMGCGLSNFFCTKCFSSFSEKEANNQIF